MRRILLVGDLKGGLSGQPYEGKGEPRCFIVLKTARKSNSWNETRLAASAAGLFALLFASQLSAQTVATYSFEDGTADGWTSFNGASTPVASNAAADSGSFSLLTTTGSGGAGGPSIHWAASCCPGRSTRSPAISNSPPVKAPPTRTSPSSAAIRVAPAEPATTRSVATRWPSPTQDGRRSVEAIP